MLSTNTDHDNANYMLHHYWRFSVNTELCKGDVVKPAHGIHAMQRFLTQCPATCVPEVQVRNFSRLILRPSTSGSKAFGIVWSWSTNPTLFDINRLILCILQQIHWQWHSLKIGKMCWEKTHIDDFQLLPVVVHYLVINCGTAHDLPSVSNNWTSTIPDHALQVSWSVSNHMGMWYVLVVPRKPMIS